MTSVWTSGRLEPGCAVSATAALHLPSEPRLRWIIGEGSQHHATVCRKSVLRAHIGAERERQAKTDACLVPSCPLARGSPKRGNGLSIVNSRWRGELSFLCHRTF